MGQYGISIIINRTDQMSPENIRNRWQGIQPDNGYTKKIFVPPLDGLYGHRGGKAVTGFSSTCAGIHYKYNSFLTLFSLFSNLKKKIVCSRFQNFCAGIQWRTTKIFLYLWTWFIFVSRRVAVVSDRNERHCARPCLSPLPWLTKIQVNA